MSNNWLLVSIFGFLVFCLIGCDRQTRSPESKQISALERIQTRGEMHVGYIHSEPCVIRDARTGEFSGIFVEMVGQIAKNMNVKVVWKETTLSNFAIGLNTGQFDFYVGPTMATIPRATVVRFTDPIAYIGNSAVVKSTSTLRPEKLADLNKPGIKVSVLKGQALEEYLRQNLPLAELVVLGGSDLTSPLVAVASGQADIGFMVSVIVDKYTAQHGDVQAVFTGAKQVEILGVSWATAAGDDRMCNFLNTSLAYLKSTGRIIEYQKKQTVGLLFDMPQLYQPR